MNYGRPDEGRQAGQGEPSQRQQEQRERNPGQQGQPYRDPFRRDPRPRPAEHGDAEREPNGGEGYVSVGGSGGGQY
jgi:hypothetical protein